MEDKTHTVTINSIPNTCTPVYATNEPPAVVHYGVGDTPGVGTYPPAFPPGSVARVWPQQPSAYDVLLQQAQTIEQLRKTIAEKDKSIEELTTIIIRHVRRKINK